MPIDIDVVDEAVHPDNGFLTDQRRMHPNAVRSHDVLSMVLGVLLRAGDDSIGRLRIFGHGRTGQQGVGGGIQRNHPDMTQRIAIDAYCELWDRGILAFLCGHFAPKGSVELHGCHVGAGWAGVILCWELSRLWRIRVRAGVADQYADRRDRFEGHQVVEANGWPGSMEPILTRYL